MITGFNHTGAVVRDLDKLVRFYTEDIGLDVLLEVDSVAPPGGITPVFRAHGGSSCSWVWPTTTGSS